MSEQIEKVIHEKENEIKQLKRQIKELQSENLLLKSKSKSTYSNLEKENKELKERIRGLEMDLSLTRRQKGVSPQISPISKSKLGASSILAQLQNKSSVIHNILLLKSPPNFTSPYIEINKQKYDNVKFIKQLKNGFERSCFDTHHFDFIDYEITKLRSHLENYYSMDVAKGLLDTNNLIVIYGSSKTQKKTILVTLLDYILKQFKQEYEIFQRNPEIQSLKLTISSLEKVNLTKGAEYNVPIQLSKQNTVVMTLFFHYYKQENDKQCKHMEIAIQKLKLNLLNKVKQQKNSKPQPKVREVQIQVEKQLDMETLTSSCLLSTSSRILQKPMYYFTEEALKEVLGYAPSDESRLITDMFSNQISNPFSLNLILCIQPQVQTYQNSANTMRLSKVCKQLKLENAEQNQISTRKTQDDKYQSMQEIQLKEYENQMKSVQYKSSMQRIEVDNLRKQVESTRKQNQDLVGRNSKLKSELETLLFTLEQLHSTINQQISLKMQKQAIKGAYMKKNASLLTFEKAQKMLNSVLFKCNATREYMASQQKSDQKHERSKYIHQQDNSIDSCNLQGDNEEQNDFQNQNYDNEDEEKNGQIYEQQEEIGYFESG